MKVPFYDLKKENLQIQEELEGIFSKSLVDSSYILGNALSNFEDAWEKYLSVPFAYGVGNGTDALIIALRSLGIESGDEVIVPAYTFVATGFAVSIVGAKPVFVDILKTTHSIDPEKIEKAITKKTKAIIPVHLYGNVADMHAINTIAQKYKIHVIEDAAQAHGAIYNKHKAGGIGDIGCFSFYPAKNLGALGDGGAIVTKNKKIAEKIMLLRNYGQRKKYFSEIVGTNSRLDDLQARILHTKLKRLDASNKLRRVIAARYIAELDKMNVEFPAETANSSSSYHLFTIQVEKRDSIMQKLKEQGIDVLIHYPIPLHLQKAYKDLNYKKGDFPISEHVANSTISLPLFPSMTENQISYVIKVLKKVL